MISLTGKIVIVVVTLAVVAGMTVTIISLSNTESDSDSDNVTTTPDEEVDEVTSTSAPGGDGGGILYEVGVGRADMTGPCVEIRFMGFANLGQRGSGIHLRQFSRAFIFVKGSTRVVIVSAEVQAVGIAVRRQVVENLQALYGDMYSLRNVFIAGTHTHSAPGGHLVDFVLDASILGFSDETFEAYVAGITRSIIRAHENMVPARLFFGTTRVANAQMNRSPYSYRYNPPQERERYDADVDSALTQVRVVKADGSLHGVLNWFAVHTTSMNLTNTLISSDNMGYAALRLEDTLNPYTINGKPEIIAAFFPANLGDVSPNIRGGRCEFSGEECDNQFLLCERSERCQSLGPGDDMYDSTRIIGTAMFEGALDVLNTPGEELRGDLVAVHQFVKFAEEVAPRYDPVTRQFDSRDRVHGCVAALGYSFASGTIDGDSGLNITQGTFDNIPELDQIVGVISSPTEEDIECHAPKPIILATGRTNWPVPWHPRIVSVSLVWLGGLVIAGIPGEPTTMSGRRVRDVIGSVMKSRGYTPRVVAAGLTNEYIHYVATREEYQVQRYEAASTIYGPSTLDIFLNKFHEFTTVAIEGGEVAAGDEPADNRNGTIRLILPVVFDRPLLNRNFGDVISQPPPVVTAGDVVSATFVGANPRNNLYQESSHVAVEKLELGEWLTVATDADWDTKFHWRRVLLGSSEVTFEWRTPNTQGVSVQATYRMVYRGTARSLLSGLTEFTGTTDTFTIN